MNRSPWLYPQPCEADVGGEPRQCRLVKLNNETALVQPLSRHPSCVHLNSLHTKIIKRHLTKHHVTMNLCGLKHRHDLVKRILKRLQKGQKVIK